MDSRASDPAWRWPRDMPTTGADAGATASSSGTDAGAAPKNRSSATGAAPKQRQYKSRTCRICLEVVEPTFDTADPTGGFFGSKPRVRYVSEDPASGRLISPCKCKGSQRFVHEGCLQAWRVSAPLSDRNYWRCPTCKFAYRMERIRWAYWVRGRIPRALMTIGIFFIAIFILGFIADPILNFWLDPLGSIADTVSDVLTDIEALKPEEPEEPSTWGYHFLKGIFSLGVLGFLRTLVTSPWQWFNYRANGIFGGARGRRGGGRDRINDISWTLVVIGVLTFLTATWKLVSLFSARVLEKVSERVLDVQGDDDDDEDDDRSGGAGNPQGGAQDAEHRKDV